MKYMSGWKVFEKEEMNQENAITVLTEMVENCEENIKKWKDGSEIRELLQCQRQALIIAIQKLSN